MNCLFCKIVEGKIPANKVYEDGDVIGFKDIQPQAPVHYLFIPKKHYESLVSIPQEEMAIVQKLVGALRQVAEKEGLAQRGFRTVMNTNQEGGQTVFHVHLHLLAGKQMGGNMAGIS